MIRPLTLICFLLAGISGLYLYQSKHRARMLDRDIAATVQATSAARERAGLLRTEWTLLNDPERLRALSDQFLQLKPVAPSQFTTMAELASRLPAPRATEPGRAPSGATEPGRAPSGATDGTESDQGEPRPSGAMAALAPVLAPEPAPPARMAPKPPAEVARQAERKPSPAMQQAPMQQAAATPHAPAARGPAQTRPAIAAIHASRPPAPVYVAQPVSAHEAVARIARGGPIDPSVPAVASALGMARTMLPPPVPVSTASAAGMPRLNGN